MSKNSNRNYIKKLEAINQELEGGTLSVNKQIEFLIMRNQALDKEIKELKSVNKRLEFKFQYQSQRTDKFENNVTEARHIIKKIESNQLEVREALDKIIFNGMLDVN